ncbi:MAG TPA: alpha-xylosidase, partial [Clostridia bacterium]
VDFTNPDAVSWYKGKLKSLLDMGVDCFKTDFGERIPTDAVYFDGSDPVRMHNFYTYLYNKAVYEVIAETRGKNDTVVFARSATAGSQKFPVHWGGDCTAYYTSMAESLRGGLSLCLSGFGFWSHDISGFDWTATPDIYKRWTAFGLLSTHSRLHGNSSYRVPWLFDEESVDVLRYFTKLKCRLMPYLFAAACEASRKGIPVMRTMILEFIEDPTCHYLDRQYMLGDSLLVAPIFNDRGCAEYYLPEGIWTNFLSGEKVEGGRWVSEIHNYMSLPLMVRPNSIIPVGNVDTRPDYDYADNVVLHVFELKDNSECSAVVCNTAGEPELNAAVKKEGDTIVVKADGTGKPWSLLLRGFDNLRSVKGGSWSKKPEGVLVTPASGENKLEIFI